MSTAVSVDARIDHVQMSDDTIMAHLVDGRVISVPLAWSWRLSDATPEQRSNWELIGDGQGVHWPDIDEDISAEGMLHGIPSRRPAARRPKAVRSKPVNGRLRVPSKRRRRRAAGR